MPIPLIPLRSSKLLLILQDFAWKLQNLWLRIPRIQKIGHGGVSECDAGRNSRDPTLSLRGRNSRVHHRYLRFGPDVDMQVIHSVFSVAQVGITVIRKCHEPLSLRDLHENPMVIDICPTSDISSNAIYHVLML